jgi:hypothetical protein
MGHINSTNDKKRRWLQHQYQSPQTSHAILPPGLWEVTINATTSSQYDTSDSSISGLTFWSSDSSIGSCDEDSEEREPTFMNPPAPPHLVVIAFGGSTRM